MSAAEILQWANMLAYALLWVGAVALGKREAWRPWAILLALWAVNNVAFYAEVLWDVLGLSPQVLNVWSSATKLHGAVMLLVGMAILAYKERLWKRKRTDG